MRPRTAAEVEHPVGCIYLLPVRAVLLSVCLFGRAWGCSCGLILQALPHADSSGQRFSEASTPTLLQIWGHIFPLRELCFVSNFLNLQYIGCTVLKWRVSSGVGRTNYQTYWRKWWKTRKKDNFCIFLSFHFPFTKQSILLFFPIKVHTRYVSMRSHITQPTVRRHFIQSILRNNVKIRMWWD